MFERIKPDKTNYCQKVCCISVDMTRMERKWNDYKDSISSQPNSMRNFHSFYARDSNLYILMTSQCNWKFFSFLNCFYLFIAFSPFLYCAPFSVCLQFHSHNLYSFGEMQWARLPKLHVKINECYTLNWIYITNRFSFYCVHV